MWGDNPDRKEPNIESDLPQPMPLSTWLTYVALVFIVLLGIIYWHYAGADLFRSAPPQAHTGPIEYRTLTSCVLAANLSCNASTIEGKATTLVITNTNKWDITSGLVTLTSKTGSCTFDGQQTLRLLPAGSVQTVLFTCAGGTGYPEHTTIENDISVSYERSDAPLTQHATGMLRKEITATQLVE